MKAGSFFNMAVRPVLFQLDAETAHNVAIKSLQRISSFRLLQGLLRQFVPTESPRTLFGLPFRNPIGLAAGFDKNAVALPALAAMGFGFVEIGTVTGRPQSGNPRPRIFRYPEQRALVNRLGFNNDGADLVANRLRKLREADRWPSIPVGINIGKSKDVSLDQAAADYLHSFRRLQPFADYVVLNVSSPNTPGLRTLQKSELLATLLESVQNENRTNRPIVMKFSPDLADEDIHEILKTCEDHRVAAIIATNTTLNHSALPPDKDQAGGLSGEPLRQRSTDLIRKISAGTIIPVIGCGGIMDAESAREKFEAGAQLIQVYTGLVYRGPGFLREISVAYLERSEG
jgi:dihydroorotate dehydrogenase